MARHVSPLRRSGRFETEGRRLLLRLLSSTARVDVALACHVSEGGVGMWSTGVARPDLDAALLLEQRFGIPMRTWACSPIANPISSEPVILKRSAAVAAQ